MSCIPTYLVILSVVLSAINCREIFYQSVEGNCRDLQALNEFDDRKIATGIWFNQYSSLGQEGNTCATVRVIERGRKNFVDFMTYDKEAKRYVVFPDDLVYNPDRPGTYTNSKGAVVYMLASDIKNYCYGYQCLEENGKTKAMVNFTTRKRAMSDKEEQVYQNITTWLAEKKLLPQMYKRTS